MYHIVMNYYDEIKNILVDNAIGRKVREYKSNQKVLESYYNVNNKNSSILLI